MSQTWKTADVLEKMPKKVEDARMAKIVSNSHILDYVHLSS